MLNLTCVILMTFVLFEIALCENYGLPSGDVCLDFKANLNSEFAKDCFQNLDECQKVMQLLEKGIGCDPKCGERERCVMVHGKLQCNCTKGYQGKYCSITKNECDSNPCQNGATCIDELNNYTCSCVSGFAGKNCETDINECDPNPCQNGATCIDELNNYNCTCVSGFTGKNCETELSCMEMGHLLNGNVNCTDGNMYSSTCSFECNQGYFLDGSTAANCSQNSSNSIKGSWSKSLPRCLEISCMVLGDFSNGNVNCTQTNVYGSHCSFQCNQGYFIDGSTSLRCSQDSGSFTRGSWSNALPQCKAKNECDSNPCQNGATCIDELNNYICSCVSGFAGKNCETDINECDPNPCQNGATCIDELNNYNCTCVSGFTGENCETGECNPGCGEREKCVQVGDSFQCNCTNSSYFGINCSLQHLNDGWFTPHNGYQYKFIDEFIVYKDIKNKCNDLGARLAATGIRNETVRRAILSNPEIPENPKIWIGLNRASFDQPWIWSDGVTASMELINQGIDLNNSLHQNSIVAIIANSSGIIHGANNNFMKAYPLCEKVLDSK